MIALHLEDIRRFLPRHIYLIQNALPQISAKKIISHMRKMKYFLGREEN